MKIQFFLILILIFQLSSCKKKNNQNPVPNISFDFTINIELPSYSDLIGVGGWAYANSGTRSIIIYRKATDLFVAFDRQSPKDENADCPQQLTPDKDNFLQLIDSCSGAKFSLYDGAAISGSEFGLRQYQTQWNGSNMLRIYN